MLFRFYTYKQPSDQQFHSSVVPFLSPSPSCSVEALEANTPVDYRILSGDFDGIPVSVRPRQHSRDPDAACWGRTPCICAHYEWLRTRQFCSFRNMRRPRALAACWADRKFPGGARYLSDRESIESGASTRPARLDP